MWVTRMPSPASTSYAPTPRHPTAWLIPQAPGSSPQGRQTRQLILCKANESNGVVARDGRSNLVSSPVSIACPSQESKPPSMAVNYKSRPSLHRLSFALIASKVSGAKPLCLLSFKHKFESNCFFWNARIQFDEPTMSLYHSYRLSRSILVLKRAS